MKTFYALLTLATFGWAKVQLTKKSFQKSNWDYCTKFGAPANSYVMFKPRSKLNNYQRQVSNLQNEVKF